MKGPHIDTGEQKPKAVPGVLSSCFTLFHSCCFFSLHRAGSFLVTLHFFPTVHPRAATDTVKGWGWVLRTCVCLTHLGSLNYWRT